jgi:Ser/Thr protein kinase RdoA (MazF antagonist)
MPLFNEMTTEQKVASLTDCVTELLAGYDLGPCDFESINHEYNSTFKITTADGTLYALRVNVNSQRTLANLAAEVQWVNAIANVKTPKPVATKSGALSSKAWHEASERTLNAVLYTWLEGEELGDEPTAEQLRAAGAAMAKLHESAAQIKLQPGAELPDLADFFWGGNDLLLSEHSQLSPEQRAMVAKFKGLIEAILSELSNTTGPQLIHADIHPWNLMWHDGEIAVFDFDDSGVGLPVQDLATSLYYLDTDEQEQDFLDGYSTVRELPQFSASQMKMLKLHRRLMLLNYLYESSTPEHKEMVPEYLAKTMTQLAEALEE